LVEPPPIQPPESSDYKPVPPPVVVNAEEVREDASVAPRLANCLNCGFSVEHTFCSRCGQENIPSKMTFFALIREVWDEFIKVDTKLLQTLFYLLCRPGYLSREYASGKRTTYISPFKLYIVTSAIFFLAVSFADGGFSKTNYSDGFQAGYESALKDTQTAKDKNGKPDTKALDPRLLTGANNQHLQINGKKVDLAKLPKTVDAYQKQQAALPESQRDSLFWHWCMERVIHLNRKGIQNDLEDTLSGYIPNLIFFMLPFFALTLKNFYRKTKKFYVEHFVFALHLHTVFFLLSTLVTFWEKLDNFISLALFIYCILAFRGMYQQSWLKTVFKNIFIAMVYGFQLILGFVIVALIAFATL